MNYLVSATRPRGGFVITFSYYYRIIILLEIARFLQKVGVTCEPRNRNKLAKGGLTMTTHNTLNRNTDFNGRKEFRKAFLSQQLLMADCQTVDDVFRDRVNNLSASGLFLKTNRGLTIGQEIAMTIELTDSPAMAIKVTGEVVRKTIDGVGVAFTIVFNY